MKCIDNKYPFCKQCSQTNEKCDEYYGEQKCLEVQIDFMLEGNEDE